MVSVEDRPVFFVHQTQKQNIDKYQKNRVCFPLSPNITVEYTPTPNTVKIAASVEDAFKSELKGFRTISTTFRRETRAAASHEAPFRLPMYLKLTLLQRLFCDRKTK